MVDCTGSCASVVSTIYINLFLGSLFFLIFVVLRRCFPQANNYVSIYTLGFMQVYQIKSFNNSCCAWIFDIYSKRFIIAKMILSLVFILVTKKSTKKQDLMRLCTLSFTFSAARWNSFSTFPWSSDSSSELPRYFSVYLFQFTKQAKAICKYFTNLMNTAKWLTSLEASLDFFVSLSQS